MRKTALTTAATATKAQQLAERLATHEHVISARASGRRLEIIFLPERGGYATMDVRVAEALAERLRV
jgi:hypothetical protein